MGKSIPHAPLAWRVPDLDRMRASQRVDSPQSRLTAALFLPITGPLPGGRPLGERQSPARRVRPLTSIMSQLDSFYV